MAHKLTAASVALALIAAQLYGSATFAAPPARVVGTWSATVNGTVENLTVIAQGAGGNGPCAFIHGTIGIAPFHGFYCSTTGRIHFVHKNLDSGGPVRVFTGNLSDEVSGQPLYIGGTMTIVNIAFGPFGEYSFSAMK